MHKQERQGRNPCSNKTADEWNRPSNHVVSAESLLSFKRLHKLLDEDDRGRWLNTGTATCKPNASLELS